MSQNKRWHLQSFLIFLIIPLSLKALEDKPPLGMETYRKLRDDLLDFTVLARADEFINSRESQGVRPSHCPLNQTNVTDLLDKLQQIHNVLEKSRCKDYKDGFLSSFGASVAKMSETAMSLPPLSQGPPLSSNSQAYYKNMNDMIASLSSLVGDSRCAMDVKDRGLIPVLADVLGSASLAALFVPNEFSFVAGASGVAVTATLKIISGLLTPDFDMKKPDDRENFIKLACSFFDIRIDLERNHFLHIPTEHDVLDHAVLKSHEVSIHSKIIALKAAKKLAKKELRRERLAYVESALGPAKMHLYAATPRIKAELKESVQEESSHARSLDFRIKLVAIVDQVLDDVTKMQFDSERYLAFTDLEADINNLVIFRTHLFTKQALAQSDIALANLFLSSFNNIVAVLEKEVAMAQTEWETLPADHKETFGQAETDIGFQFDKHIDILSAVLANVKREESELAKIIAKKNFSDDDDGTHIDHLIIEEIKKIQNIFFGHYGWRFYEYIRNTSEKELIDFYRNFTKFRENYLSKKSSVSRIVSDYERRVACATAAQIILTVNNSRSLINMGTDFIFTNRDFFHNNAQPIDFHLSFIPTGISKEKLLLQQAEAVVATKAFLAEHKHISFPEMLQKNRFGHVVDIGELMVAQTYADKQIELLYQFTGANRCGR